MLIRMRKTSRIVLHLILAFTHSHLFTFLKQKTKFVGFFFCVGKEKSKKKMSSFLLEILHCFADFLRIFWFFFSFGQWRNFCLLSFMFFFKLWVVFLIWKMKHSYMFMNYEPFFSWMKSPFSRCEKYNVVKIIWKK